MSDIDAFPLAWPIGWERTPRPQQRRAQFKTSFARARDGVLDELSLMGAPMNQVVISSNIPLRRDGLPYANTRQPDDPGIAVYFVRGGEQKCIPCDRWDRVEDNLQAIRKTVEALRGLDRWGAKHMVDAAFQGFAALPAGSDTGWWTVLGVERDDPDDVIHRAYRARIRETHPDWGGDVEVYHQVQTAHNQWQEEGGDQ